MREKVLVVEDYNASQLVYKAALEEISGGAFQVVLARTGEEGLEVIKREKIAAAVIDILLPKMSGLEFIQQMKARLCGRRIPAIVLTALSRRDVSCMSGTEYAEKVLFAPLDDIEDLTRVVAEVIQGRKPVPLKERVMVTLCHYRLWPCPR